MTPIPTESTKHEDIVYRSRDGKDIPIATMSPEELIEALFDMLNRKAKHNHKVNKMFAVGETLDVVARHIHQELGQRNARSEDFWQLQIAADLGTLQLVKSATSITLQSSDGTT